MVATDRCPVCGGRRLRAAFEEPPYSVMRCPECGTGIVSPRRADLESIYDRSYWRSESPKTLGYQDYRAAEPLYLKTFRRRLSFALKDGPRGGRALDVGCAAGFCMAALRELGFDAYGVDVSAEIASHAIDRFGFDTVHIGSLDSAQFEEHSFDLITLWDVVEHVTDPTGLLRAARRVLKPDGLLVLETQNIDSAFARVLGPRWHHYKHAEHIFHFTPRAVRRLLGQSGFGVQVLTPRYAGKYVSLAFIAERAARVHPLLSAALRPVRGLDSVSLYCNVMDEMIAIARPAG
jgi:2-polyprenyl-3-methyl-5-hydroxy-6-metoxy-1,4-benzoquinol methylase